ADGNQVLSQDTAGILDREEPNDRFGMWVGAGDFDGDGYDDLVAGVPLEDVGSIADAGMVNVIYGGPSGLDPAGNQVWSQDSPEILDQAEAGDSFGGCLGAGDYDADGHDDLVTSARYEDLDTIVDAGAVHVILGTDAGLTAAGNQLWTQDSPGILDQAEPGDRLGGVLR